ncbi:hypothetical protein OAT92_06680 [Porticoccaceae bacterium]|nr:hypothetical protein [Porticoccaceae bacterium]
MSKKVIYVSWTRLTDRYARDWYINHLIQSGIEVEYWDVVAFTREQHDEFGELDVNYLRVVQSLREFESLVQLKENTDAVYVMLMTLTWQSRLPYQLLTKYNRKMAFIIWGSMPNLPDSILRRAVSKIITSPSEFFRHAFELVGLIVLKKIKLIKPFDTVFSAGSAISISDHFAKKVVPFHLVDYDHYMRVKEDAKRLVKGKYAVFLDLNLPYQSDFSLTGLQTVKPHDYYQSLNKFFGLLAQQYDVKIVIAAHPKTSTDSKVFGELEIYRLSTAELVKDAEFVITHHSTSLSYAVLNTKPCVFIYTNEMDELYPNCRVASIKLYASYLDAPVYNIDQISEGSEVLVGAPKVIRYDDYKFRYLISKESDNKLSQDIFLKEIQLS